VRQPDKLFNSFYIAYELEETREISVVMTTLIAEEESKQQGSGVTVPQRLQQDTE